MRILTFDFSTKNCETDDDLMLQYAQECFNTEINVYPEESIEIENDEINSEDTNLFNIFEEPSSKIKSQKKSKSCYDGVRRYVLGFGIFKKIKCSNCQLIMKKNSCQTQLKKNEIFIHAKDFGSSLKGCDYLTNPSDYFLKIFNCQFTAFSNYFKINIHKVHLKASILKKCVEATNKKYPEWFDESNPCYDHRMSILEYILKCLIKRNSKWFVKNSKTSKKYLSRLRHLRD